MHCYNSNDNYYLSQLLFQALIMLIYSRKEIGVLTLAGRKRIDGVDEGGNESWPFGGKMLKLRM